MNPQKHKMISVLGDGYFQPVADLIENALKYPPTKRSAVHALYLDNIYSVSIILLLVATIESYASRVRYLNKIEIKVKTTMKPTTQFLKSVLPGLRYGKALTEVFVLRDAIIHNHLWESTFTWNPMTIDHEDYFTQKPDSKFNNCVSLDTRRTKTLNLHVVPTRIDRRDAVKVLNIVWKTLLLLEKKDLNYCSVSKTDVRFKNSILPFTTVSNTFAASL